jgi:hypothetical protein
MVLLMALVTVLVMLRIVQENAVVQLKLMNAVNVAVTGLPAQVQQFN